MTAPIRTRTPRSIAPAVVLLVSLVALVVPRSSSALQAPKDFPIGWYDVLSRPGNVSTFAGQRMTAALPYDASGANPAQYLDAASASGIQVMLEIPRPIVRFVDVINLRKFVATYKAHPALLGWFLADEPSINRSLGPLAPTSAIALYDALKREDPVHPVSIVFSSGEDPTPYLPALDILMHDDYPAFAGKAEFQTLPYWLSQTGRMSRLAKNEHAFYSVIQGFGGTNEQPVFNRRLPTAAEERYMVYTALQAGADGLLFWTYYRSDPSWSQNVLLPIVAELEPMRPALAAGQVSGAVSSVRSDTLAVAFRDPASGRHYVVAVHHAAGAVEAPLNFAGPLAGKTTATLLGPTPTDVPISGGRLEQVLGSYEVKVYALD